MRRALRLLYEVRYFDDLLTPRLARDFDFFFEYRGILKISQSGKSDDDVTGFGEANPESPNFR